MSAARDTHNQKQKAYFEERERSRIAVADTAYVLAHVDRMVEGAALAPDHSILEIGSGLGKFTLQLAARGYRVTANDLTESLLNRMAASAEGRLETLCCDAHDIARHTGQRFDRVIGFFVLHHMVDFPRLFKSLAEVLKPGGRVAFIEPVGTNPLYYAQILFTPGMRLSGEPSLPRMRRNVILPALAEAGFTDTQAVPYGYFPPVIKNRGWGNRMEAWMERHPIPFPHAFQTFMARLPD